MSAARAIGVAGCGVGGLAVATLLKHAGANVVVFDRLAVPAPIGSGLIVQPVGMAVLDLMGAGAAMRALGAPIRRLHGRSEPSGRVVLDVRYDALGGRAGAGLGVHRGALFEVLLGAARKAGVAFETGREIAAAEDGRLLFTDGRESARFDLVVDALGARSPLSAAAPPLAYGALWANLDWRDGFAEDALEQRYVAARKMAGVMPIGRLPGERQAKAAFFWSLRHADHAAWRAAPLETWKRDVAALWPAAAPLIAPLRGHDDLVFAAYVHRTLRSPIEARLAHVGDSWHATSPQLGQGANMALLDALALALSLERQSDLAVALGEYERLRLWHIRLYQLASWMFTPAYQSDARAIAWVRDHLVAPFLPMAPVPQVLAALVAGQIGWPLAAMGAREGLAHAFAHTPLLQRSA